MVRAIKILILCLLTVSGFAQVVQERNARGADRIIILKDGFRVPIRDTATAPALLNYSGDSSRGGVVYDSTLQKLCFWTGVRWVCLDDSATGSSIDTTSLSNRINLKLNISDTATMNANFIYGIGAGTNVTVDNTNPRFPVVNAAGGGGTPGGGQFAIQYSRGGAFAGSQNFVFDSARNSVGINTLPTATGGVLRVLRNSTPGSLDTIVTFLGSDNKTLTGLRSFGGQNWNMYNNVTNAYTGQIQYSTPGSASQPGILFSNASGTGRTDIRYQNYGIYFTSHALGTIPENNNANGVLIRGNGTTTYPAQLSIGSASPGASTRLNLTSTTGGALLAPMTSAQREAISSPPVGLITTSSSQFGAIYFRHTNTHAPISGFMTNSILTGNTTLAFTNTLNVIDATSGNITLTLPTVNNVSFVGLELIVIRRDNSDNTVTVQRGGTNTILNAGTSFTVSAFERVELTPVSASQWSATVQTTK